MVVELWKLDLIDDNRQVALVGHALMKKGENVFLIANVTLSKWP